MSGSLGTLLNTGRLLADRWRLLFLSAGLLAQNQNKRGVTSSVDGQPKKPKQTTQWQIDPLGTLFTLQPEKTRHLRKRFWKLDILPFPTVHQLAYNSLDHCHHSSANRRCFPYVKQFCAKKPFFLVPFFPESDLMRHLWKRISKLDIFPFPTMRQSYFKLLDKSFVGKRQLPMGALERLF